MKPGTPLPWHGGLQISGPQGTIIAKVQNASVAYGRDYQCAHAPIEEYAQQNAVYIVHAANLYPELVAALELAQELTTTARRYFPKSMHNGDKFSLETTCAAIGTVLAKCERDAYPSGTVDDLERYPNDGSPWPGEGAPSA